MTQNQKELVVMQILPSLQSGGVERGTIDIAKALKKEHIESLVVSSGGQLTHQLSEAEIKHITLPVHSKNPFVIYSNIQKIVKLIEEFKVTVVHVRSRAPMWSAYYACKKTNTKLVSTVHGTYSVKFWKWEKFAPKVFYNAIMLRADAIIVVSNFIKEYLMQNYHKKNQVFDEETLGKITVIQRGVDLNYFNSDRVSKSRVINLIQKWNLPEDRKIIMLPARFTEWKGHEFLIEALTKVKSDFCCILVGSDHGHKNFRKKIENIVTKSNLDGKVKVVGVCQDMPAAYAVSHLVICSSVRPEAFGRIAIEAQAANKIIIATNIGGSLETILDEKTGFLVEVGDSDKLAELIDKVLGFNEEELKKIGNAGRTHVEENFSSQKMCKKTIEVYRSVRD